MFGKCLKNTRRLTDMPAVDAMLPRFYSPLSSDALQEENAGKAIAIVGTMCQQSFGVRLSFLMIYQCDLFPKALR